MGEGYIWLVLVERKNRYGRERDEELGLERSLLMINRYASMPTRGNDQGIHGCGSCCKNTSWFGKVGFI